MSARSGPRSGKRGEIVIVRERKRERGRRGRGGVEGRGGNWENKWEMSDKKLRKRTERAVQMAENRWFLVKIGHRRRGGYQAVLNWTTIIISTSRPFRPRLFLQRRILFQRVPGNCRFDDAGQAEPAFAGKERGEKRGEEERRSESGKERIVMDVATWARSPLLCIFQRERKEKFDRKACDFFQRRLQSSTTKIRNVKLEFSELNFPLCHN